MAQLHDTRDLPEHPRIEPTPLLGMAALQVERGGPAGGGLLERHAIVARVSGVAVTGFNRRLGAPLFDFGAPLGTAGFNSVAQWNPRGHEPIPLSPTTPRTAVLATYVDPEFLAIVGKSPGDVEPAVLNVPYREVAAQWEEPPVRRALRGVLEVEPFEPSQAWPYDPITLADWLGCSGRATVQCRRNETTVRIEMKGLLPNRLYDVWAVFDNFVTIPLGGAPSVVVSDEAGRGRFYRLLSRCPFDPAPGEPRLLSIAVVLHLDQQNYAVATTDVSDPSRALDGIVKAVQLGFFLAGTPVAHGAGPTNE